MSYLRTQTKVRSLSSKMKVKVIQITLISP